MRTLSKYAAAATLTGALALVAATPSQARWYGHHGHGNGAAAAIGFGAGALLGAAAASTYYGPHYYAPGPYAYEPGPYAYEPAPAYGYSYGRRGSGPNSANYSNNTGCSTSGEMYGHTNDAAACY
jgi:hypothetical protein